MAPPLFWIAAASVFGAVFGSFLNVCIFRLPRGGSVVFPTSSHCPSCDHPIAWYDNVPILSYALLAGRCRSCGGTISARYPLVEALTAALFARTAAEVLLPDPSLALFPRLAALLAFECALVVASFVDLDFQVIPDEISLGGMVAGPAAALLLPLLGPAASLFGNPLPGLAAPLPVRCLLWSLLGLAAGTVLLGAVRALGTWIFRKEAMGLGDVKLIGMMGSFLGPLSVFFILALGSLIGAFVGVALLLRKGTRVIPFGPYLSAGALIFLFAEPHLWRFTTVTWPRWLDAATVWVGRW